jgi:hypothetical protein
VRFAGFIGPSYVAQSVTVDNQRTVDLYPEINPLGTGKEREVACLAPTPGLLLKLTLAESPVRAVYTASNGEVYAVGGTKLYSISSSWVATQLGALNSSEGVVSMADNGTHLVLVDGTDGYVWNMSTDSFAEISDPDFKAADHVAYLDGYFIFNETGTQRFFFSDLNSTDLDALDIGSATGFPDLLVGLVAHNQNLVLFGAQSYEVFYNSGDANETFQRIQGAVGGIGCIAPHSIASLQESVYWLGGDKAGSGIVYRSQGYQAVRISTPAIESVIRGLAVTDLPDARAWTYQQGGHVFYCLNLPGANSTWVYDASTQMWHERNYTGLHNLERHRADCHAVAFGQNIVGDYVNGKIYALDSETYSDAGNPISRIRRAPIISENGKLLRHNAIQIDMETGVGLDGTGQGTDPVVMMRFSDDEGRTWSNERQASAGKIGKTKTRVVFRRLGASRSRIYEFKITDPVKVVLIGAELDVEGGTA